MDTVTYPDPRVAAAISAHFVPVKLQLGRPERRDQVRALGPLWTPTYYVLDPRGRELRRDFGFLAPDDFLATLAIGAGQGLAATGRIDRARQVLDEAIGRHGDGAFRPELLYWRGALGFLRARDHAELLTWWNRLRADYPDDVWARRCVTERCVTEEEEAARTANPRPPTGQ